MLGLVRSAQAQSAAVGAPEADLGEQEAGEPRASGLGAGSVDYLEKLAKERFNQGVLEQDPALLERALDALKLGMTLSDAPGFVFNAALVEQRLGHCAEAEELYRRFLTVHPTSKRRERVERQLQQLETCAEGEPDRARSVLPGLVTPWHWPGSGPSTRAPAIVWAELESTAPSPGLDGERIVVWSLAGGAAVSAVLATVFAVQAWSAHHEIDQISENPMAPGAGERIPELQQEGHEAQTRARVFGVVAGGLGLAAGVGFWLLSPSPKRGPERSASDVVLEVRPDGVGAEWRMQF